MSEKEMNLYRFASGQEPSEEMLAQIMKEVAEEAVEKYQRARHAHFTAMRKETSEKKLKWAKRINGIRLNGTDK